MTKSVRSAHAEKSFNANQNIVNKRKFGFFSPNSGQKSNQEGLETDPVAQKLDEWGMSVESLDKVNNVDLIGAGGKYEKKVIKQDL